MIFLSILNIILWSISSIRSDSQQPKSQNSSNSSNTSTPKSKIMIPGPTTLMTSTASTTLSSNYSNNSLSYTSDSSIVSLIYIKDSIFMYYSNKICFNNL